MNVCCTSVPQRTLSRVARVGLTQRQCWKSRCIVINMRSVYPFGDPLSETARYRAYRRKLLVWSVVARVIAFCTLAAVIVWHSERKHHATGTDSVTSADHLRDGIGGRNNSDSWLR